jgi:hypothetical protein
MTRNRVLTRLTMLASLSLAMLAACSDGTETITVPEGRPRSVMSPIDPYDPTDPSDPSYSSGACNFTVTTPSDLRMTVSQRLQVPASVSGCSESIIWTADPADLVTLSNKTNYGVDIFAKKAGKVTIKGTIGATSKSFELQLVNAQIVVDPTSATILVNGTRQLYVRAYDHTGWEIGSNQDRAWSITSTNSAVATINTSNLVVTGKSAGTAQIQISLAGGTGTSLITVVSDPVATVTVSPNPATVSTGQTVPLTATLKSSNGTVLTGRTVTWTSDHPSIATVSSSGVVTGVAAGSTTIRATAEGRTGISALTVSQTISPPTRCNDCTPWVPLGTGF